MKIYDTRGESRRPIVVPELGEVEIAEIAHRAEVDVTVLKDLLAGRKFVFAVPSASVIVRASRGRITYQDLLEWMSLPASQYDRWSRDEPQR